MVLSYQYGPVLGREELRRSRRRRACQRRAWSIKAGGFESGRKPEGVCQLDQGGESGAGSREARVWQLCVNPGIAVGRNARTQEVQLAPIASGEEGGASWGRGVAALGL